MNQLFLLIGLLLFSISCTSQNTAKSEYETKIETLRLKKDKQFKEDVYSPIPNVLKDKFKALNYFNIDSNWNKKVTIVPFIKKDSIEFTTSKNKKRWYLKYAKIIFEHNNKTQELVLYSSTDTIKYKHLFLPFKDASNGKTTYGAGRYLDMNLPIKSKMFVDFNLAYNPYCAYNVNYSCPLVPAENQLDIPILVGEKSPNFIKH